MGIPFSRFALAALVTVTFVATPGLPTSEQPNGNSADPPATIVSREILIGFRDMVPVDMAEWVSEHEGEVLLVEDDLLWISARFADAGAANAAIRAAQARQDVVWAEHDRYLESTSASFVPNDPLFSQQWGFEAIQAPAAWNVTLGSHDVKIAVLDSGIDGHLDLFANMCGPHESFSGGSPTVDLWGHGTHVAGTAASVTNNSFGVSGTSQSCLMSVKVLDDTGRAQDSWIAAGISWAAKTGADIISMSIGSWPPPYYEPTQALEDAVNKAYASNVLLIAAAGNSNCLIGGDSTVGWPARFPAVMAVAMGALPDGSVRHIDSSCGPEIEISAPGESILSTEIAGGYGNRTGTSHATPLVSGVAALVKSIAPNITAPALRLLLNETADDVWDVGWDPETGWGRLNATAAVRQATV